MKALVWLCCVVLLVVSTNAGAQTAKWTFMVYLAADNDLEPFGIADFNEMEMVGSSSDVQIIVQMDRSPEYDNTNGNWTDTRRYRVLQDFNTSVISSPVVQNLGEVNMGDPARLVEFVNWAKANYPADHYCLVLWNHGGGWRASRTASMNSLRRALVTAAGGAGTIGDLVTPRRQNGASLPSFSNPFRSSWGPGKDVCVDQTDNDRLLSDEVAGGLTTIGGTIDILGYDACLMGMIENAYEVRSSINVMVGSEETEPGDGWPYNTILADLAANPNMTAAALGSLIVQKYGQFYGPSGGNNQTLSAYDMTKLGTVVTRLGAFTAAVTNAASWTLVGQAQSSTDSYNEKQNIDLYDFAGNVSTALSVPAVTTAATELKTAISDMVIQNYAEPGHGNSHGLAIYAPPVSAYDPRYANGVLKIDFSNDTQWDEFLQSVYTSGPGGGSANVDPYEPNDGLTQAYGPISAGTGYRGVITSRNDADCFKFVAGSTFDVRIDLTVPADYDLFLYKKQGDGYVRLDSSTNYNLDPERIEQTALSSGEYYAVVAYLWNNDNFSSDPYTLTVTMTGGGGSVDLLLGFDDGTPDYGIYSNRTDMNEGVACYFTPPETPAVLRGFWYNFPSIDVVPGGGSSGSFYAFGADYYGPILPDTMRYVTPGSTGWQFLDLSADNITLYGDFFAGMFWDTWNTPMIGWDTSTTNGLNLIFTEIGGIADWYLGAGTFFIRAQVGYQNEVTGVQEEILLAPKRFSLDQNYPNPFNPTTNITFEIPGSAGGAANANSGLVSLKVYDILGREVATLVEGMVQVGEHTVRWDASGLPGGVYFYRLHGPDVDITRKLMLVK